MGRLNFREGRKNLIRIQSPAIPVENQSARTAMRLILFLFAAITLFSCHKGIRAQKLTGWSTSIPSVILYTLFRWENCPTK
jgi:hypothetical protein